MKISELIEQLELKKTEHGDITVGYFFFDSFYSFTIENVPEDELHKGAIVLKNDKKLGQTLR